MMSNTQSLSKHVATLEFQMRMSTFYYRDEFSKKKKKKKEKKKEGFLMYSLHYFKLQMVL